MRKMFFIAVAIFICSTAQVQAQEFIYAQIVGQGRLLSNRIDVSIDYGQEAGLFTDRRLRDENGRVITFNSMVDAMNFMGADGWQFVQAYVITVGNNNVLHWLLKKRVDLLSPEEREQVLNRLNTRRSGN